MRRFILPSNRPPRAAQQSGNRLEQSRFASAVGADEGDDFSGANRRDSTPCSAAKRAIGDFKIFHFKHDSL